MPLLQLGGGWARVKTSMQHPRMGPWFRLPEPATTRLSSAQLQDNYAEIEWFCLGMLLVAERPRVPVPFSCPRALPAVQTLADPISELLYVCSVLVGNRAACELSAGAPNESILWDHNIQGQGRDQPWTWACLAAARSTQDAAVAAWGLRDQMYCSTGLHPVARINIKWFSCNKLYRLRRACERLRQPKTVTLLLKSDLCWCFAASLWTTCRPSFLESKR